MLKIKSSKNKKARLVAATTALALIALSVGGGYMMLLASAPIYMDIAAKPIAIEDVKTLPRVNRIIIPKINVDIPYSSGDKSVLEDGAWWRYPERGTPGSKEGNVIMAAHRFEMRPTPQDTARQSPFYHIDKVHVGDMVYIDYESERFSYKVTEKIHVKPDAIEIESPSKNRLTLYSCDLYGEKSGRLVLLAELQ